MENFIFPSVLLKGKLVLKKGAKRIFLLRNVVVVYNNPLIKEIKLFGIVSIGISTSAEELLYSGRAELLRSECKLMPAQINKGDLNLRRLGISSSEVSLKKSEFYVVRPGPNKVEY